MISLYHSLIVWKPNRSPYLFLVRFFSLCSYVLVPLCCYNKKPIDWMAWITEVYLSQSFREAGRSEIKEPAHSLGWGGPLPAIIGGHLLALCSRGQSGERSQSVFWDTVPSVWSGVGRGSLNQYAIQLRDSTRFHRFGVQICKTTVFSPTHSPLPDSSWKLVLLTDLPQIRGCQNPSMDFRCRSQV